MSQESNPKTVRTTKTGVRRFGKILAVLLILSLVLVVAAGLLAERVLNTPSVKKQVVQILAQAGVKVSYHRVGVSYAPLPVIRVAGVDFFSPEGLAIQVKEIRILPDLAGLVDLLQGGFPGRIEMIEPEIQLLLPKGWSEGAAPTGAAESGTHPTGGMPAVAQLSRYCGEIIVRGGQVTIHSHEAILEGSDLTMQARLGEGAQGAVLLALETSLSGMAVEKPDGRWEMHGATLDLTARVDENSVKVDLVDFTLDAPRLTLAGSFVWTGQEVELTLAGQNLEVAAVRTTALGLAGDLTPIPEIFRYLVAGEVPEIHFHDQAKTLHGLAENFRLEGELIHGEVSVPELELDLQEVSGRVKIADWVLEGSDLTARLGKSTGRKGVLAIGLEEDLDRFLLDIELDADLAEAREVAARLVEDKWLTEKLARVTKIEGHGRGRLRVGETFSQPEVQLKEMAVTGTASYQGLPGPVVVEDGRLDLDEKGLRLHGVTGRLGKSALTGLAGELDWDDGLRLVCEVESGDLVSDELFPWLRGMEPLRPVFSRVKSVDGRLLLGESSFTGLTADETTWHYSSTATIKGVSVQLISQDFPWKLKKGEVRLAGSTLDWQQVVVEALDGSLIVSGTLKDKGQATVDFDGKLGSNSLTQLEKELQLPRELALRGPVNFKGARLIVGGEGPESFTGRVGFAGGPELDIEASTGTYGLRVKRLKVKGVGGDEATVRYLPGKTGTELEFSGKIGDGTLKAIFLTPVMAQGQFDGALVLVLPDSEESTATVEGQVSGERIFLPLTADESLTVERGALSGQGALLQAEIAGLGWRGYLADDLRGTVEIKPRGIDAVIREGSLCGISFTGRGSVASGEFDGTVDLGGGVVDAASSYGCLSRGETKITGKLAMTGTVSAKGEGSNLLPSLTGPLQLRFTEGMIEKGQTFAAILEVLNVTEVVKGRLPNLATRGLPYHELMVQGRFSEGEFVIDELVMDGETLDLFGNGAIDLERKTIQLELLAAPFQTMDTLIKYIPGINYLMGGRLVAIPLSVSGPLEQPEVQVMSPSSVSNSLLKLGERTIKLPFKLLESILPTD